MSHDAAASPWWRNAVVYQVYPRSFADSDGDGVGDLRGLVSKLDYLAALGVDAVWASPFFRSPQHDNSYDISDYRDVDPLFGTIEDVDELIDGLHARGMKLLIDVVVNHTSDEHPWFLESRSSRDNPRRDWYWWRPPRPGRRAGEAGAEPTNWMSHFSEPAWTLDEVTGEYYLHLFSRHQPDLNWENADVRRAVYETLTWWLERGVDGFRMDVINMISKRLPLADGPVLGDTAFGDGSTAFTCGPRIHEFLQELHREVLAQHNGALMTVGEMPGVTVDEARLFTDPARREVDMVLQFEHVQLDHGPGGSFDVRPLQVADLKESMNRWQLGLADIGWNALYFSNHDQPRALSRFGCDHPEHRQASAKTLATVLHLHRGTPFVYQGEELGMTNHPFAALDQFADIESVNYRRRATQAGATDDAILESLRRRSRDNARTPMQWSARAGAGFTTGTPWLAVNPNHREINAEAQVGDPDSVFNHFRRLIAIRHEYPVVVEGDFTMLLDDHPQIYAFTRRHEDHQLLVLANMSCHEAVARLSQADQWASARLLVATDPASPASVAADVTLRSWEAAVYLTDTPAS